MRVFTLRARLRARSMIPNNSGKIINIASIAGFGGSRPDGGGLLGRLQYEQGALITLTQALATEWGKHNINVNAICPGYFPTKLSAGLAERADEIAEVTPLGRAGGDYDIKGPVVFFASEASRHVSGQPLAIDGGGSAVILN